jgi:hypothetical protein
MVDHVEEVVVVSHIRKHAGIVPESVDDPIGIEALFRPAGVFWPGAVAGEPPSHTRLETNRYQATAVGGRKVSE